MFENPRRGRQAGNFATNVPKILDLKSSSANRYFWKIDIGCPWLPALYPWKMFCHFWTDMVSVWMARGIRSKKIFIHLNGLGYLFAGKNCRPFEQLVLSVPKKNVIRLNGLGCLFGKNCHLLEWLGISVSKNCYPFGWLGLSIRKRNCRPLEELNLSVQR